MEVVVVDDLNEQGTDKYTKEVRERGTNPFSRKMDRTQNNSRTRHEWHEE